MNMGWKCFLVIMVGLMTACTVWAEESIPASKESATAAGPTAAVSAPTVSMEQTPHWSIIYLGAAASSGVIILGAAYGISKIGASAVESMARQPEAANSINTAMVVSAALIEGVTFLALIVCLLSMFFK